MARLALMTVGILHAPANDPREKGFIDRLDGVWEAASKNPSFIAADGFTGLGNEGPNSWGRQPDQNRPASSSTQTIPVRGYLQ